MDKPSFYVYETSRRQEAEVREIVMKRANNLCECTASIEKHPGHKNRKGPCGRTLKIRNGFYRVNSNRPPFADNLIVVCPYCKGRIESERRGTVL